MPTGIDQNLIPQLIRNSVDPELLNCAQSIEWSIDRNCGRNEHGYLESSSPAIATELAMNDNTMTSSLRTSSSARKSRRLEWADSPSSGGRDSGFDMTPTSPYKPNQQRRIDLSPLDESMAFDEQYGSLKPGQYSAHPTGDVVFEAAPRARAGERTVHYEKVSRIVGEQELQAMGLDPNNYSGGMPMISGTMDDSLYRSSSGFDTNASFFGERQRARSLSPTGDSSLDDQRKKTVIFGSMEEIDTREQEYFPYRDAHQGKPLPGDNEYGTWGSRFDDKRQWKLCNGQWVRVNAPKPKPVLKEPEPPQMQELTPKRVRVKPPKRVQVARAEPVRLARPAPGKQQREPEEPSEPDRLARKSSSRSPSPLPQSPIELDLDLDLDDREPPKRPVDLDKPVDIEALKDKYRPKPDKQVKSPPKTATKPKRQPPTRPANNDDDDDDTGAKMLVAPKPPPTVEIKVEPIQPTYVEVKRPLKMPDGDEEKRMEDPNLMWMHMGPAQYGPPFGTLRKRKGREEDWYGPPCELCHKQIEERRCMLAENMKFHCWHFACSFCLKTLKPADFLIAEADRKPYCLNCHKREFPEISLAHLKLETEVEA